MLNKCYRWFIYYTQQESIKKSLSFWLILLFLPVLLIITFRSYLSIQYFTNQANDQSLFKVALAIASQIEQTPEQTIQLPNDVLHHFKHYLNGDHFSYVILDQQRSAILGDRHLPLPAQLPNIDQEIFYSDKFQGEDFRLVAFHYPINQTSIMIIVAETFEMRNQMHQDIVAVFLITTVIIAILILLALNLSVKRGLTSLALFRDQVVTRNPTDTTPLDYQSAPKELQPLAIAMNDLFIRVKKIVEEKENFIANASHQLKTPLAGLKLHVENAQRETDLEHLQHSLGQINLSTDKLSRLNDQLLNLAMVEFSAKEKNNNTTTEFDLVALARQVIAEWVPSAINAQMDLGISHTLDSLNMRGQPTLIKELLNNLIHNAILYNPAKTRITVTISLTAATVALTVEDNGIGIPAAEQAKIFQRFYRPFGNNNTTGCGLGMAIVKEVVEQHGGHIKLGFSNPAYATGTKVVCLFPIGINTDTVHATAD